MNTFFITSIDDFWNEIVEEIVTTIDINDLIKLDQILSENNIFSKRKVIKIF